MMKERAAQVRAHALGYQCGHLLADEREGVSDERKRY